MQYAMHTAAGAERVVRASYWAQTNSVSTV